MSTRREFLGILAGAAAVAVLPEPILRRAYQRFGGAESPERRITAAIAQAVRETQSMIFVPREWIPYGTPISFASNVRLVRGLPQE